MRDQSIDDHTKVHLLRLSFKTDPLLFILEQFHWVVTSVPRFIEAQSAVIGFCWGAVVAGPGIEDLTSEPVFQHVIRWLSQGWIGVLALAIATFQLLALLRRNVPIRRRAAFSMACLFGVLALNYLWFTMNWTIGGAPEIGRARPMAAIVYTLLFLENAWVYFRLVCRNGHS